MAVNEAGRLVGCQARPWVQALGEDLFVERLGKVMCEIADLGFAAFETGLAFLPLDDPVSFRQLAARAGGLKLSGAHTGAAWWTPASEQLVDETVERARLLPGLGCERLVVSMNEPHSRLTDDELAKMTTNLSTLGRRCGRHGVEVVFHNHAHELGENGRVIDAIVGRCAPDEVQLGADLGWVAKAGVDVGAFIGRYGGRLAYLHVRDVTATGRFIEVGRGALDLAGILAALDAEGYQGWLILESEFGMLWGGDTSPTRTAAFQLDGLMRLVHR